MIQRLVERYALPFGLRGSTFFFRGPNECCFVQNFNRIGEARKACEVSPRSLVLLDFGTPIYC